MSKTSVPVETTPAPVEPEATRKPVVPPPEREESSSALPIAEAERLGLWLSRLTERQLAVMQRRFGLGGAPVQSLAEIGRDLGITRERARQIQEEAMRKLRKLSQDE